MMSEDETIRILNLTIDQYKADFEKRSNEFVEQFENVNDKEFAEKEIVNLGWVWDYLCCLDNPQYNEKFFISYDKRKLRNKIDAHIDKNGLESLYYSTRAKINFLESTISEIESQSMEDFRNEIFEATKSELIRKEPKHNDISKANKESLEPIYNEVFKGNYFYLFDSLIDGQNKSTELADISFFYRKMHELGMIHNWIGESHFRDWLRSNEIAFLDNQLKTIDRCMTDKKLRIFNDLKGVFDKN